MGPEVGQPWTTVPGRRRQRRRPAAASEGERTSDGSSAGSVTPHQAAAGEEPEVLSMHPEAAHVLMRAASDEPIASPRLDDEQLLAAAEAPAASPGSTASSAKPLQPAAQRQRQQQQGKQRSGRQQAQQAQQGLQQAQQQQAGQQQQRQQVPLLPLPRQDSRSASDLAGMGKAPLRSAKSDVASLTVQTARSSTASGKAGGGAAAAAVSLEGIPETARGGSPLAPGSAKAPRRPGSAAAAQPFARYLAAELHPGPSYPTADVVWGQTERDRVYNALVAVPYQLERFLLFGVALCLDSFLAIFTLLPLRVGLALLALGRSLLFRGGSTPVAGAAGAAGAACGAFQPGSPLPLRGLSQLRGDQLFDLLGAAMSLGVVIFLWNLNAGTLYFWMKDLTQELLKLSVLYTALELSDKICCSFGVDVLEALAASCTQLAAAWTPRAAFNLACDVAVASLLLVLHGATLMSQAMVFGVAMNSKKNTLVALLIAANFTEIKGTVLKRFDATKLYTLACQDVVERFHLLLILAFVVVEEMGNSGAHTPNPVVLWGCLRIYAGEVVIDVIKHAVLGKFNEIRPGVYREYMRDLCDRVSTAQSHNIHKLVGFEPFAPAALFFRIALTAAALARPHGGGTADGLSALQCVLAVALAVAVWGLLLVTKLVLGYLLRLIATTYVQHYDDKRAAATRTASRALEARRRTMGGAALQAAAAGGGKKEE